MPILRRGATVLVLAAGVGAAAWSAQHGSSAPAAAGQPPPVRVVGLDAGRSVCFTFTWGNGEVPTKLRPCATPAPRGAIQIRLPSRPQGTPPTMTAVVVGVDGVHGSRCFTLTAGEHRPVAHACTHRP